MLDLVKTSGGPSSTVLSAPIVNVPRLPAENDWPAALGIVLEARVTPAYAARYPRSAGVQSSDDSMGPSSHEFFTQPGVPRPVSAILPRYLAVSRTAAAAPMPTVVGEMMPFRFGYCCSSPCVTWVDVVGSSFP